MFSISKAALLPTLPCLLAAISMSASLTAAQAQASPPAQPASVRQDPADPKVAVPPISYRSSFSLYQAFTEPEVAPWRGTNDLVRQRGGWRAYAREAREPNGAQSPTPVSPAPPASAPAATKPGASPMPAMPGHKMN